jgi:hypothetical protein
MAPFSVESWTMGNLIEFKRLEFVFEQSTVTALNGRFGVRVPAMTMADLGVSADVIAICA